MTAQGIDLFDWPFWVTLLVASGVLALVSAPHVRKGAFAAINMAFLLFCLGSNTVLLLVFLALLYVSIKAVQHIRHTCFILCPIALLAVILFVLNKIPSLAPHFEGGATQTVLTVIGYSYFFLRGIDLFRAVVEDRTSCPTMIDCINYLLPFHMLAAGPIQSYDDYLYTRDDVPALTFVDALEATERIAFGLFKKYVVAYAIEHLALTGFNSTGLYLFFEIHLFFLWLYADFSAYSDIAVGCGKLMGVHTPENFNKPYLARNIIDFWERWHMSLSKFILRNIFIPIQLNLYRRVPRKPLLSATVAFSVAFLLCGLWHDTSWKFLFWGGFHALGLVICNAYKDALARRIGAKGVKKYLQIKPIQIASTIITYEFVAFSLYLIG